VTLETKPIEQAHVCVGVRSYPLSHQDRYTVQLLATVLGGGMSSRLTEELTMKRGLAYSVFAINHSHTDAGSFWVQGGFNAEKVDDAVAAIVEQLRQVADEAVPQEELDKARNYAKGRFVFSLETPQGIINHALKGEVLEGRPREPEDVLTALDRVTSEDLQRVAGDLVTEGFRAAVIGPYDEPGRFEQLLS
jgi:predicted Zn-dependent peptidase